MDIVSRIVKRTRLVHIDAQVMDGIRRRLELETSLKSIVVECGDGDLLLLTANDGEKLVAERQVRRVARIGERRSDGVPETLTAGKRVNVVPVGTVKAMRTMLAAVGHDAVIGACRIGDDLRRLRIGIVGRIPLVRHGELVGPGRRHRDRRT